MMTTQSLNRMSNAIIISYNDDAMETSVPIPTGAPIKTCPEDVEDCGQAACKSTGGWLSGTLR